VTTVKQLEDMATARLMYRVAMNSLQERVMQTFGSLQYNEQFEPLRPGLINLYKSIIEMAQYRIKVLTEVNK
jgi:hypothetical protein